MTPFQVIDVLRQAGFSGVHLVEALAVAMAESSLDSFAHATKGEDSRGLFQINVAPGAHPQLAVDNLYDPLTNAEQAYAISNGGTNWSAWTTWTGGKAQSLMGQAAAYITNAVGASPAASAVNSAVSTITSPAPKQPSLSFPDIPGALSSIASSASGAASSVGQAVSDAQTLIGFLQLPQLYLRLSLGLLGGLLIVVGLVLFAVSFMPRSVSQQLATAAKAAAA